MAVQEDAFKYQSLMPDAQGYISYSTEDNQVWRDLYKQQRQIITGRVCEEFIEGVDRLHITQDTIPQLKHLNEILGRLSNFSVAPVPAIISAKAFFQLLADRKFPVATFIRRREDFDYLEEPDIFHEIFGHCPLLGDPVYADFLHRFGEIALALPSQYLWSMQRIFWFTVEFGLIQTRNGPRVYGAGIASSPGETVYAVESHIPDIREFDLLSVLRTPYRIDEFQTIYYVIEDFKQLHQILDQDLIPLMDKAKELGLDIKKAPDHVL